MMYVCNYCVHLLFFQTVPVETYCASFADLFGVICHMHHVDELALSEIKSTVKKPLADAPCTNSLNQFAT